jgi:hypothetical protein
MHRLFHEPHPRPEHGAPVELHPAAEPLIAPAEHRQSVPLARHGSHSTRVHATKTFFELSRGAGPREIDSRAASAIDAFVRRKMDAALETLLEEQ